MDLTNCTCALASAKKRIALSGFTGPAKPAPTTRRLSFFLLLVHQGWNVGELLKILVFAVREDRIRAVALLRLLGLSASLLQLLACFRIADLLYSKLHSANF